MKNSVRIRTAVVCATATIGLMTPFLFAGSADAIGNNRTVTRSCGQNHVASGKIAATSTRSAYTWAQTTRVNGDCGGYLSVALQYTDGRRSSRKTQPDHITSAYTEVTGTAFSYGLHWGCDTCNVTYS